MGKEDYLTSRINNTFYHERGANMKSLFGQMGGTYRREGYYLIPNMEPPDTEPYQIGKYGLMRKAYLKDRRPGIYTAMLLNGTLHSHLSEIDQTCNERMERGKEPYGKYTNPRLFPETQDRHYELLGHRLY